MVYKNVFMFFTCGFRSTARYGNCWLLQFESQHSDWENSSSSFFTLRVNRSNSAAASVRIVFLSGVDSPTPLVGGRGEPGVAPFPPPGDPGTFAFLLSNELKKLANTPSPPGPPGVNFESIYEFMKKAQWYERLTVNNVYFELKEALPLFEALISMLRAVFASAIRP